MIDNELVPEHHLHRFKTLDDWTHAVLERGGWVFDAPEFCGHPDGTLYAGTEDGTIGICLPSGEGTLLKTSAMRCNG
jgi:hypothetical protein